VNSTVEALDDNKVKLSVDVAEEEIEGAIDAAFKKIGKEVRLPGFRPGKVPRRVLEARFGKDFARGEALRDAIPEFYVQAVREHEVDVIAPPDFEITAGEQDGPITFEAVVETRPVVEIAGYADLQVEIPIPLVNDADIAEHLDNLRGNFAELASVERPAADGDHVTIDIAGTHDGEDVPGLTADDYVYEVGSGAVVEEIDANLIGASVGDVVEFSADHPDPEEEGELDFRIVVKDIQEKVLPELDDEFAKQASEFETLAELTADVQDKLAAGKRQRSASAASEKVGEALADLVALDPPEPMIDSEVQSRLQDLMQRLQQSGIDVNQYFQITGQTPEQLTATMREPARQGVKLDLALRHVALAEALTATDDDLDAEFEKLAVQIGSDSASIREQFASLGTMFEFRADIAKNKAMEWITEHVTLVDEDGNTVDRSLLDEPEVEPEPESAEEEEFADAAAADEEE
jgi:trigger factor